MKLDWRNSLLQIFLTNFLSAPHEDPRCLWNMQILSKFNRLLRIKECDPKCSDEIHSCLRTFISNTARTATILNRHNRRRQCSKQHSRQCVETDQFGRYFEWMPKLQTLAEKYQKATKNQVTWPLKAGKQTKQGTQPLHKASNLLVILIEPLSLK